MRNVTICLALFAALSIAPAALAARDEGQKKAAGGEVKVKLADVPKAVVQAVKAKYPKGKLTEASKETEDGKTVYEVTVMDGKTHIDVTVTPEGKIILVEKTIAAKDLPRAVADALEKRHPGAKVNLAEEISKDDKVTGYEVVVETKGKKLMEVNFAPDGKFVKEEEKKAEKE